MPKRRSAAAVDIVSVVAVFDRIREINTLPALQDFKPMMVRAAADLRAYLTDQQTQINSLQTQVTNLIASTNQNQARIAGLTNQINELNAEVMTKQKIIDELNARQGGESSPASPLKLATSFKSIVDQIQQQARADTGSGAATTLRNMDIEVKALVTVQGSEPVLFLPSPGSTVDSNQLSTMRLSFAAIPTLPPPATAPQPVPAAGLSTGPAMTPQPPPVPGGRQPSASADNSPLTKKGPRRGSGKPRRTPARRSR
jgi:hypothetical protein